MRIGIISDTHGWLNNAVFKVFHGMDQILHAGDVGRDAILSDLETIAPIIAVSGNVDGMPTPRRPQQYISTLDGVRVCMTHGHLLDQRDYNRSALELFKAHEPQLIIHGHSHIARNDLVDGIRFLNPGAACKPRFRDVPSVAIVELRDGAIQGAEIIRI